MSISSINYFIVNLHCKLNNRKLIFATHFQSFTNMLIPEWSKQVGILMAWPDAKTDWVDILSEAETCYKNIIKEIITHQKVFLLCQNIPETRGKLSDINQTNLVFIEAQYNDTWARDFGPLAINKEDEHLGFLDFGFNGWGEKFEAGLDNMLNTKLLQNRILPNLTDFNRFILEGGSVETDGKGTLLSTSHCLLAPNRNQPMTLSEIEEFLTSSLGINHFLWLDHGYLSGDDTDSHIDTLARFCDPDTICYVSVPEPQDEHYEELLKMEKQLKSFRNKNGQPYQLIALPFADAVYDENGDRLPATYANFLITNEKVLVPTYNSPKDELALMAIEGIFKNRKVVGVDCTALIKQHGSLHCITMQIPDFNS